VASLQHALASPQHLVASPQHLVASPGHSQGGHENDNAADTVAVDELNEADRSRQVDHFTRVTNSMSHPERLHRELRTGTQSC